MRLPLEHSEGAGTGHGLEMRAREVLIFSVGKLSVRNRDEFFVVFLFSPSV